VTRTGAQLLAAAMRNVHGWYDGEPQLRWDVLQEVAERTHVPLVLHGLRHPSGRPGPGHTLGVGKVNFTTELRARACWPRCRSGCRGTGRATAKTSKVC
jgi:tagatose 1,6-diphosphate aldolase GatY/KbaY